MLHIIVLTSADMCSEGYNTWCVCVYVLTTILTLQATISTQKENETKEKTKQNTQRTKEHKKPKQKKTKNNTIKSYHQEMVREMDCG